MPDLHMYCTPIDIVGFCLQVTLLQQDMILVFINQGASHWTLLVCCLFPIYNSTLCTKLYFCGKVLDMKNKLAEYYDSLGGNSSSHWQAIRYVAADVYAFNVNICYVEHFSMSAVMTREYHV